MSAAVLELVRDSSLTEGLDDSEARMLIEALAVAIDHEPAQAGHLKMRGRLIVHLVRLWAARKFGAVAQLAAVNQVHECLPTPFVSSEEFMERMIVTCLK
ncbi:MAG: hypothetical protein KJS91_12945 [Planctomycetes bacterium]|jgi:hypothetical protein|nr:hypothetical protein [Planctomycetota bacterium]